MRKYLKIFSGLVKNNLLREMEFRANFFIWFFVEISYVLAQVVLIGLYFNFTDNISGWTKSQVFLLIGIFRVIEGFFHIFFHQNLLNFPENITTGNMDFFLTRPVNTLFLASLRYHGLDEVGTVVMGLALVVYSLIQLHLGFSASLIIELTILASFGLLALYSVILIFSCLSFFFTRLTALGSIWEVVSKTLRIPTDVLTKNNIIGNTLLFPLLIVVTLPAQIILGHVNIYFFAMEIVSSLALFFVAYKLFYFALRRYSSASS